MDCQSRIVLLVFWVTCGEAFCLSLTRGSLWDLTGAESCVCECPSEGHIWLSGTMRHWDSFATHWGQRGLADSMACMQRGSAKLTLRSMNQGSQKIPFFFYFVSFLFIAPAFHPPLHRTDPRTQSCTAEINNRILISFGEYHVPCSFKSVAAWISILP